MEDAVAQEKGHTADNKRRRQRGIQQIPRVHHSARRRGVRSGGGKLSRVSTSAVAPKMTVSFFGALPTVAVQNFTLCMPGADSVHHWDDSFAMDTLNKFMDRVIISSFGFVFMLVLSSHTV